CFDLRLKGELALFQESKCFWRRALRNGNCSLASGRRKRPCARRYCRGCARKSPTPTVRNAGGDLAVKQTTFVLSIIDGRKPGQFACAAGQSWFLARNELFRVTITAP